MKLSIIVPVYNMEKDSKLVFCLESLIHQTISDYEIIAVDDASTDHSLDILNSYKEKYPHLFQVFSQPVNKKQGSAKNLGLAHASGEYVGFIDSDDWISEDYYEKLLKRAAETGADMVSCYYNLVDHHTFTVGTPVPDSAPHLQGVLDEKAHKELFLFPGSMVLKIYKRDIIVKNKLSFPEEIFYEDNCAAPIWSLYFTHYEFVDEPLYYYYQDSSSTVHQVSTEKLRHRMISMEQMLQELKDRGFYESYKTEAENLFTRLFFVNTLFSYMLSKKEKGIRFVLELRKKMLSCFPNFMQNPYYFIKDEEERKMIALCVKHPVLFYTYYSLLWFYRRLRK